MHKIFIDSDVILDVFAKRQPFYEHSARILTLCEQKKVLGYTTPLVFANIHYILGKLKSKDYALQSLRKLRIIVDVLPMDSANIDQALNSNFSDFEDALQYYSSRSRQIDFIITRNKKDYTAGSEITVCTPEEYLAILDTNGENGVSREDDISE